MNTLRHVHYLLDRRICLALKSHMNLIVGDIMRSVLLFLQLLLVVQSVWVRTTSGPDQVLLQMAMRMAMEAMAIEDGIILAIEVHQAQGLRLALHDMLDLPMVDLRTEIEMTAHGDLHGSVVHRRT